MGRNNKTLRSPEGEAKAEGDKGLGAGIEGGEGEQEEEISEVEEDEEMEDVKNLVLAVRIIGEERRKEREEREKHMTEWWQEIKRAEEREDKIWGKIEEITASLVREKQERKEEIGAERKKREEENEKLRKEMQSLKNEVESLRGELEEAKNNNGVGLWGQAKAQSHEKEKKEREEREEKLEWEMELIQRRSRRKNVIIEGLKEEKRKERKEVEEWAREVLEVDIGVESIRLVGENKLLVEFKCREDKEEIMAAKMKLKGTNVYVGDDLTWRERKGRMEVRKRAKEEREKGKNVTAKGNKIWVDGNLWIWDEREMGFVQGRSGRERRRDGAKRAEE